MGEAVQRHLESMTEEIEELGRTKLFSLEERKVLLKRRKEYEYNINGNAKNLQDIKKYIQFEKAFLKQIKLRREKYRIADKKQSIEFKVIKRIKALYEIALLRYSNDFSICLSYFEFCKQFNFHQIATQHLMNMIEMFSNKKEVFQLASSWLMNTNKSLALSTIHKGLTIHKNTKSLYIDAIKLELSTNKEKEKPNDELGCERLKTYMKSIFTNIKDFNDLIDILKEILELLEPHCYTEPIQNFIIEELIKLYPNEELVWHTIAQREKNGFHFNLKENKIRKSSKFCLERCIQTYCDGLTKVPESRKSALWSLYLDTLIELQDQSPNLASVSISYCSLKVHALKNALERASKEVQLEEKHYAAWAELCKDDERALVAVLEKGTTALPRSCLLWELHLKYYIIKDQDDEVKKIFSKAIEHLQELAEPLWTMLINYHLLKSSNELIEAIYLDAISIKRPEQISNVFKPQYISWLVIMKGIEEAREAYKSIAQKPPLCKELHVAMAKAESLEATGLGLDFNEWEKCLKLACQQFGKEDADVWIMYIEFYLLHKKSFDMNERIQEICAEAERNLPNMLRCDFREKLNLVLAD